jgi:hypothetical protein
MYSVSLGRSVSEANRSGLNRLAVNIDSSDMLARNVPKAHQAAVCYVDVNCGGRRRVLMDGRRFVRSIGHAGCTDPWIFEDKVVVIACNTIRILRRRGDGNT